MLRICFIFASVASVVLGDALASGQDYSDTYSPASLSISFYQKHISDLHYGHCQFKPSCSHYALEACNKYGALRGAVLTTDRLIRCNKGAKSFYPKTPDGRLSDPVAVFQTKTQLLTPMWLLPLDDSLPSPIERSESPGANNSLSEHATYSKEAITVSTYIAFANNLASEGDCERAVIAYKFVAFLTGSDKVLMWSKMKSGRCYYRLEQWDRAAEEFLNAASFSKEGIEKDDAFFMAAASRFNAQGYGNCIRMLDLCSGNNGSEAGNDDASSNSQVGNFIDQVDALSERTDHSTSYERISFLRGLAFMAQGDWGAGITELEDIKANYNNSPFAGRALFLVERAKRADAIPSRNPTLAMILSAIIPGSGQVYSGRASDGLRHFIFDGLLGYGMYKLIAEENYTGAYLLAGVTLPFYAGNIAGAKRSGEYFTRSKRVDAISKWVDESDDLGPFK